MTEYTDDTAAQATAFWNEARSCLHPQFSLLVLASAGFLTGDGLVRAKMADRTVTVRGLAERDVMADLAVWTLAYSDTATDLATAQENVDRDTRQLEEFFTDLGFPEDALQAVSVNASSYTPEDGITRYTVNQRMSLRTTDIERAQRAVRQEVRAGEAGCAAAKTRT